MVNLFATLDEALLIDKLAEYSFKYTRLVTEGGFQPDVDNCKMMMEELQAEIERRRAVVRE